MRDGTALLSAHLSMPERATWARGDAEGCVPLGAPALDTALGGGLARGRLHEVFARSPADSVAAAGFSAMLAIRVPGEIIWLRQARTARSVPYPPGLAEIGLDPARLVLVTLPDVTALLRAAADAVRCPGVGVVMVSVAGNPRLLDLTATRRLALAAERTGATVLLTRVAAKENPSAARTRWRVAAAPSAPLAGMAPGAPLAGMAPGAPTLRLELPRRRGGPPAGPWVMEWDRAERCLRPFGETARAARDAAALPRALPAAARPGPDTPERRIA